MEKEKIRIKIKDIPLTSTDRDIIENYKKYFYKEGDHWLTRSIRELYEDIKVRGILNPIEVFKLQKPLPIPRNIDKGLQRLTCCELLGIEEVEIWIKS